MEELTKSPVEEAPDSLVVDGPIGPTWLVVDEATGPLVEEALCLLLEEVSELLMKELLEPPVE